MAPNFKRPPPDMIEGQAEFEVEEIRNIKKDRGTWKWLVKWSGYEEAENTWEPIENLTNSMQQVERYHAVHPKETKSIKLSSSI